MGEGVTSGHSLAPSILSVAPLVCGILCSILMCDCNPRSVAALWSHWLQLFLVLESSTKGVEGSTEAGDDVEEVGGFLDSRKFLLLSMSRLI